ncbi:hypothetical protein BASA62_006582 [Batrachochytrium salamandrivorans]|nr:hypothetical protein BASA62_006582 [Batrachochytrium salamandrivorans]
MAGVEDDSISIVKQKMLPHSVDFVDHPTSMQSGLRPVSRPKLVYVASTDSDCTSARGQTRSCVEDSYNYKLPHPTFCCRTMAFVNTTSEETDCGLLIARRQFGVGDPLPVGSNLEKCQALARVERGTDVGCETRELLLPNMRSCASYTTVITVVLAAIWILVYCDPLLPVQSNCHMPEHARDCR